MSVSLPRAALLALATSVLGCATTRPAPPPAGAGPAPAEVAAPTPGPAPTAAASASPGPAPLAGPAPSRPAPSPGASPAEAPAPSAARPALEPTAYAVEPAATLLVLASGRAFLLLGAAPLADAEGRPGLSLTYLASPEAGRALEPDAAQEVVASAEELFQAFRSQAEADGQRAVTVTAVFGRGGQPGAVCQVPFAREGEEWSRGEVARRGATRLPPIPDDVERAAEAERAGAAAAERFVAEVDRVELDAAWSATSAAVKAVTSRKTFEYQLLDLVARRGAAQRRRALFCRYAAGGGAPAPGALMRIRFESQAEAGRVVEEVQLRLDDDREWRVAGLGFGRG